MARSKLAITVCALLLLTISATGTVAAAPESPGGGIESPLTGVESEYDAANSSDSSIQTANSVGATAEDLGDVPPNVSLTIGSSSGGNVSINEIIPTDDGNYVIIGSIVNSSTSVGGVIKFSPKPNESVLWSERYGNENQRQRLGSGIQTQSGDYVLSGWTETADSYTG